MNPIVKINHPYINAYVHKNLEEEKAFTRRWYDIVIDLIQSSLFLSRNRHAMRGRVNQGASFLNPNLLRSRLIFYKLTRRVFARSCASHSYVCTAALQGFMFAGFLHDGSGI